MKELSFKKMEEVNGGCSSSDPNMVGWNAMWNEAWFFLSHFSYVSITYTNMGNGCWYSSGGASNTI